MRSAAFVGLLVTVGPTVMAADSLRISSSGFEQNAVMPSRFTCEGAGVNSELQLSGIPPAAKSLVLIVFDPDVPKSIKSDGRYLHWALWDLPPDTATIGEGQHAKGLNESGVGSYVPACPPNGEHRYVFQVFALDTTLGAARISRESDLRRAMEGHVLDQTELVGRYTTRVFRIMRLVVAAIVLLVVFFVVRRVARRRQAAT
jgi:Raf kinase inhibitor-like YbhB/YbcL family protein